MDRTGAHEDNISELKRVLELRGLLVSIKYDDDAASGSKKHRGGNTRISAPCNILGMFANRKTACINVLGAGCKRGAADGGTLSVMYLPTNLQRPPFPKAQFDAVVTLENDESQYYSRLAKSYMDAGGAIDVIPHDLNMVVLVLYHNIVHASADLEASSIRRVLGAMMALECHEDNLPTATVQACMLTRLLQTARPRKLEFTQHLSRYSQVVATRRRLRSVRHHDDIQAALCILDARGCTGSEYEQLNTGLKQTLYRRLKLKME